MKKSAAEKLKALVKPKILFEDNYLLVLDKPSGVVVNRAKTVREETLQDWIIANSEWRMAKSKLYRSGIVHRLDKETSGLLLVAKTKIAFENLQKQFKEREVKKRYLALVHGRFKPEKGEIFLPVGRIKKDREKFGVVVEGRMARTKYKTLRYYDTGTLGEFSFLELEPLTGRTHQLRVHLSFFGHPIMSDLKYGGKRGRADRLICPRIFLHAQYLGFYHPEDKSFCEFTSSLPSELKNAILKICEKSSS